MSELGTRPGCALLEFVEVKQVADRNGRHHGPFSVVACVVPAARKVAAVSGSRERGVLGVRGRVMDASGGIVNLYTAAENAEGVE